MSVDVSRCSTCGVKKVEEREERGEKKEGGSKKEKRKERLGSVRLQRRTRLFVCVRPFYVEQ